MNNTNKEYAGILTCNGDVDKYLRNIRTQIGELNVQHENVATKATFLIKDVTIIEKLIDKTNSLEGKQDNLKFKLFCGTKKAMTEVPLTMFK